MLNSSGTVIIDVFLNLRFLEGRGWLVERHLDGLLVVGHDDGAEGGVGCVDLRVVDRPETVEHQVGFVPVQDGKTF